MASGQAGKAQVRAFRFATRQVEWALSQGQSLVTVDPGQRARRWSVVSFFLALLILVGFTVYGFIKPAPNWRNSTLVLDTDAGALYLNRGGVLYPALNLTSALLAMDAGADAGRAIPSDLTSKDIADAPRGATMGIAGAPAQLPNGLVPATWGACDQVTLDNTLAQPEDHPSITTTVVVGTQVPGEQMTSDHAALVRVLPSDAAAGRADNSEVWFLWQGGRSRVDLADPVILRTFGFDESQVRPISVGLLNTVPEVAPIAVPTVPGAGEPTTGYDLQQMPVGEVFAIQRATGDQFYVVGRAGISPISRTVADLLRFADSDSVRIPLIPPDEVAGVPLEPDLLDTGAIPPSIPDFASVQAEPLLCTRWDGTDPGQVSLEMFTAAESPDPAAVIDLAGNSAAQAQQVIVPPGQGAVVREWVPGQPPSTGTIYLVSDLGIAFPVTSTLELQKLALSSDPRVAPAAFLSLLPKGPVLDSAAAQQLHDVPAVLDAADGTPMPAQSSQVPAQTPN